MDEKDRRIRQLERQIEQMQREVDTLKEQDRRPRYKIEPFDEGTGRYAYSQWGTPSPQARPRRAALIAVGSLAAVAAMVAVVIFAVFALVNQVDKESTALAEGLLQAVVEQDGDRAYALTYPDAVARDEFQQEFETMCATWRAGGGGDSFVLKRTSWSLDSSGSVAEHVSIYEVASGEARFILKLTRLAHGETTGIAWAQLRR